MCKYRLVTRNRISRKQHLLLVEPSCAIVWNPTCKTCSPMLQVQAGDEANQAIANAVAEEELEALQGELVKARVRL